MQTGALTRAPACGALLPRAQLRSLALATLKSGHAEALEVVLRVCEIEELPLSRLALVASAGETLAAALRAHGAGVVRLELGFNSLEAKGAAAAAEAASQHESLKTLGLASNRLGDEGFRQVGEAFERVGLGALESVDLSANACGAEGAYALACSLAAARDAALAEQEAGGAQRLKRLDLSRNRFSGTDGEEALKAFCEESGVELIL